MYVGVVRPIVYQNHAEDLGVASIVVTTLQYIQYLPRGFREQVKIYYVRTYS